VTSGGWRIARTALERALSPRTRAVVVVHPNNPTGSFVSQDERAWLEPLCARCGLALVSDEVFLDYGRGAASEETFATLRGAPAFALSGLSKVAGLPQMKLGWIALAGPEPLRREALERLEFISDAYLSVGAPAQHAAARLLALRADVQRQIRERVDANERVLRELCARRRGFHVPPREGGWYAVLELAPDTDEEALCTALLERHGVLAHPGFFFDFERTGVLVLSLLTDPKDFAEGVARVIESANSM
jgi:aspartate/methionine/tyrosine aminotransferase